MRILCQGIIKGNIQMTVIPDYQTRRIIVRAETISRPPKKPNLVLLPATAKAPSEIDVPEFLKPRPSRRAAFSLREWFVNLFRPRAVEKRG